MFSFFRFRTRRRPQQRCSQQSRPNHRQPSRQAKSQVEALEARNLLAGDPILAGESLLISEFSADTTATFPTRIRSSEAEDFAGESLSPDWIEIFNASDRSIDLAGMHLTDDVADLNKWEFPDGLSIDPGATQLVFASAQDITDVALDENGIPHTNFRLAGDGEYLALTDETGRVIHDFSPFPVQRTDISYGVPMTVRDLVNSETNVEYFVPNSEPDSNWSQAGFDDPRFVAGASPLGYDRGGGDTEPAETVGAELIDRSRLDFARGSMVVLESRPFRQSGRVTEWSFYSEKTLAVTPLIFRANGSDYEIVGVGQARVSDGTGVQTFAFDLQAGIADVEPDEFFFGIKDGDNSEDTAGVVVWANSDTDTVRRFNGPLAGSLTVGSAFSDGRSFGRAFSLQATTSAKLAGPFNTDVGTAMSAASSLLVRFPFSVDDTRNLRSLSLDVRYEDGFVAYLNGVEIASRNAPANVRFDSVATSNSSLTNANRFETINVSASIKTLVQGENVLAVHALNDRVGGAEFLIDAQLSAVEIVSTEGQGFIAEPTPGQVNARVFSGFTGAPLPSQSRGFFEDPFELTLNNATAGATTYYTTDGTPPAPSNPTAKLYQAPVSIADTTVLRAAAFHSDLLPSAAVSHTFIFPQDVANQPTMNRDVVDHPVWGPQLTDSLKALPTISLMTAEPITVEGELFTSAEMIHPDGTVGFQIDAGVEVFGGTAVSFPKRSMRLSFKNIYGPTTLQHDVFGDGGVSEFDQLLLRPGSHDAPFWNGAPGESSYIRNRWVNDRQLELGHPSPRGRFVHLYLNGTYWGQFQLMQRPNAAFMASHFGGQPEDYDALNAGNAVDGDEQAWEALQAAVGESYEKVKEYLDVENYADYVLLQFFGGNDIDWREDANWMAARRREPGAGFQFFGWDSDIFMRRGANIDIVNFGGPGLLLTRNGGLQQYPEFRQLLAERAQLHFFGDGILTDENVRRSIDEIAANMRPAIVAETARWGAGNYTPDTWEGAIDWIKETYVPEIGPGRAAIVIEQLRHAGLFPLSSQPEFSIDGNLLTDGSLSVGDSLTMSAPQGDIYYTLDGSDPWNRQPTVEYTSLVAATNQARVMVPIDGSLNTTWQSPTFDDATWMPGTSAIGFDTGDEFDSLIAFDVQESMKDINASAYIRIPFQVDDPSQFETLRFSLQYDDGFVAQLNGTEIARRNAPEAPLWNSRSVRVRTNIEATVFEPFNLTRDLGLLRAGENVLTIHAMNSDVANVDLLISPKLEAGRVTDIGLAADAQRYSNPIDVPAGANVVARTIWADQWSPSHTASTVSGFPIRITEVMYHPADPSESEIAAGFDDADEFEFIELTNVSDVDVELTNLSLIESSFGGQTEGVAFSFRDGDRISLAAGERLVVVENINAFRQRYDDEISVAGEWVGGLSNRAEQITLAANGQAYLQFRYDDGWYSESDGGGSSLQIIDETDSDFTQWNQAESWQPSSQVGGTPGAASNEIFAGDSNGDGIFNSADLVLVFAAGEYEDGIAGNSTFAEGDWNGDGDFTSRDIVLAFQIGKYVSAARPMSVSRHSLFDITERKNTLPRFAPFELVDDENRST